MITRLARYSIGFILAVLLAEALGAAFQVQGNIRQQFAPAGIEVPLADQLAWTWHDIKGFYTEGAYPLLYPILLTLGLLIAFVAAGFTARLAPALRTLVFVVAGGAAVFAIMLLSKPAFFGVTLIYGARDALGMGLQGAAGAAAGLVFALVTRRNA